MNLEVIMNQVNLSMRTSKTREKAKFEKVFVDGYYDAIRAFYSLNLNEDEELKSQSLKELESPPARELDTEAIRELGYKCGVEDTKAIVADHNTIETR